MSNYLRILLSGLGTKYSPVHGNFWPCIVSCKVGSCSSVFAFLKTSRKKINKVRNAFARNRSIFTASDITVDIVDLFFSIPFFPSKVNFYAAN